MAFKILGLLNIVIICLIIAVTVAAHIRMQDDKNANDSRFGKCRLHKRQYIHTEHTLAHNNVIFPEGRKLNKTLGTNIRRLRRDSHMHAIQKRSPDDESNFQKEDIGWSTINEQVDMVIPMLLSHLQKLDIEHLQLPDMKETITVSPLFLSYETGLFLTNGIVYNIDGIQRYGDAFMTYKDRAFVTRFNLLINSLQFEYNFLLKLMALEGYGKVIGALDDTIISAELAINVLNSTLKLHDFRIKKFSNIYVQLDQQRIIRQLTGLILTPITNLFKDRITTSISDGLKDQMQLIMDDFNDNDPLQLQQFTKKMISSLLGQALTE